MGICVDRAWLGGVCTLLRAAPDPTHVHVIAEGRVGPVLEAALVAHIVEDARRYGRGGGGDAQGCAGEPAAAPHGLLVDAAEREHRELGWEARDTPAGSRAALALRTPPGTPLQETLSHTPPAGPTPATGAPAHGPGNLRHS